MPIETIISRSIWTSFEMQYEPYSPIFNTKRQHKQPKECNWNFSIVSSVNHQFL